MRKFLWLLPWFWLCFPTVAQNPQCPTRPLGDATAACASTAFVNQYGTGTVSGTTTPNLPVIGNATGNGFAQGTRQGNTTKYATATGTFINGNCRATDVNGNEIDAGVTCNGGAGSGTITAGSANQIPFYSGAGTTIAGGTALYAGSMACNGSTDDTTAFQAAVTAAAGGLLILPSGVCIISSTVTSSAPIYVMGQGSGSGPGVVSNSATVIKSSSGFTTGDIFQCNSFYQCTFAHMRFDAATARTANGAIRINGNGGTGSTNAYSLIFDVAFANQYVDIWGIQIGLIDINHTYHQTFSRAAIYETTISGIELGGGKIHDNFIFDPGASGSPGTPPSCIEIHGGYFDVYSNHILGCQIGINMICDTYACGSPKMEDNVIENNTVDGIAIGASGGFSVSMLNIHDNEISNVAFSTNLQAGIAINAFTGGGNLQAVQIHDNVIRNTFTRNPSFCITVNQAVLVGGTQNSGAINHNVCQDLTGTFAIGIETNSASGWFAEDNLFPGFPASRWYALSSNTILVDHTGIPFANLPSVGSGSEIFVTDGAPGSNPCTGSSSGAHGFRAGGGWKCF